MTSIALRRVLRDSLDRSITVGISIRRARRWLDRARHRAARVGNIAMLHAGRCGSSVVADLLNQRPDFRWAGELFESMPSYYYRLNSERRAKERIADSMFRTGTAYFGFDSKYLPEQHLRPELANKSIEDYVGLLRELGFAHFILLGRRNHLRRAVSLMVGTKTGQWNTLGTVQSTTIRLDPQRIVSYQTEMSLLEYFRSLDEARERARAAIGTASLLELEYERDIERGPGVAYDKVCAWLGLSPQAVRVRLKKLNDRPMSEIVENFQEIRTFLSGTPHEWMLADTTPAFRNGQACAD